MSQHLHAGCFLSTVTQVERSNRRIRHGTDLFRTEIQKESVGSVSEKNVFRRGPVGSLPTNSSRISEDISDRFRSDSMNERRRK